MVSPVAWIIMGLSLMLAYGLVIDVFFDIDVFTPRTITNSLIIYVFFVIGAFIKWLQ